MSMSRIGVVAAAGRGLLSADSADRIVRRVPLIARIGQVVVPALSVETLRIAAGLPALRIDDRGGEQVAIALGDVAVPVQSDGTFHVYFAPHDAQRFVSAADVYSGQPVGERARDRIIEHMDLLDQSLPPGVA